MPKSRNRKNHKKKVEARRKRMDAKKELWRISSEKWLSKE